MRRFFSVLCLALTAAACACAAGLASAQPGVTDTEIRLGTSLVLSGPSRVLGEEMRAGMEAYLRRANAMGGVDGRRVRLIARDDGYEPERAADNTAKLINDDGVFALVGYVGTPTTTAALPVFSAARVPLVGAFTGAASLRDPVNRYMFNIRASYNDEGAPLAKLLAEYGKVALFVQDDGYGKAVTDAMVRGLARYGLKPVVIATVKRNAPAGSPEIEEAAEKIVASGANAVAIGSVYGSVAGLNNALRRMGAHPVLASVSFVGTTALLQRLKQDAVAPVNSQVIGISQVVPSPTSQAIALTREFRIDMQAIGAPLTYGALEGYIDTKVLVEGMRRCGSSLSRARLIDALERMERYDLGGFQVSFSPQSHSGSNFTELTVVSRDLQLLR